MTESRKLTFVIGAVLLLLVVIGLVTYSSNKNTAEAQQKAEQLTQKLEAAGLRAPVTDDIFIRTLGTDGGNVCDNPSSALGRATLLDAMFNGADFVGRRPVRVDRRVIQGQLLIMETYCPDKLQDFKDDFQDLKFDDVIND